MKFYTRDPVAAGSFYPLDGKQLRDAISELFPRKPYSKRKGFLEGLVAPHAGYAYSGRIAAKAYYDLSKCEPRTFVVLGPNHTGMGDPLSIMFNADYSTPLGRVRTNAKLGRELCKELGVTNDFLAHSKEHSVEVQLPFLQFLYQDPQILPIVLGDLELSQLRALGSALASKDVTVIASSDFTHHGDVYGYSPLDNVEVELQGHDMHAIKLIQELEVEDFFELGLKSSICGFRPITVLMQAMKERGASPHFKGYATSAEVTGDYDNVVGYASLIFK